MTDILIREVDDAIAERLRQIAVERNWPVNQVILHALRLALGLGGEELVRRDRQDIALQTARFLKSRYPNSTVKLKDLQTGEEAVVAFKSGQ